MNMETTKAANPCCKEGTAVKRAWRVPVRSQGIDSRHWRGQTLFTWVNRKTVAVCWLLTLTTSVFMQKWRKVDPMIMFCDINCCIHWDRSYFSWFGSSCRSIGFTGYLIIKHIKLILISNCITFFWETEFTKIKWLLSLHTYIYTII